MQLKVSLKVEYSEVYCTNCGKSIYKFGEESDSLTYTEINFTDEVSAICERCGSDEMWCGIVGVRVES